MTTATDLASATRAQLVARLQSQRIEVHRAAAPIALSDGKFPAGTYVVRLDQPYRNYAVDLLTPQNFPKGAGEPYARLFDRRLAGDGARSTALTDELPRAVAWLVCHRLLVAHEGEWRAVILALARMNFESNGPANIAEATTPRPAPPPAERGRTAAVQRHQVEFFTLDGYREANGSTQ